MLLFMLFIMGLIIGSFLNVVIYRVPRGESIVFPASHCTNCGKKLAPWELIPVISYFLLKGRCNECGEKISIRYPTIETCTGLVFLVNGFIFNDIIIILTGVILSSILIVLSMIDIDHQILPDSITLGGLAIGLIISLIRPDLNMLNSIAGILAAGGLLFLIAFISKGGIGGGDIKMMAMVGSFLGPLSATFAIFFGAVIGLIASLPGIISGNLKLKSKLPFGPFLALASLVFWFWGNNFWDWYLQLFL